MKNEKMKIMGHEEAVCLVKARLMSININVEKREKRTKKTKK